MEDIRLYDFKKSEKFSLENIRNLALVCEEFCKTSNMQINYETKNDGFRMALNKCIQTTYGEFIESINGDNVVIEYSILPIVDNLVLFFHVLQAYIFSLINYQIDISTILNLY